MSDPYLDIHVAIPLSVNLVNFSMCLLSEEAGIHRSHSLPLHRGDLIGIDGGGVTKRERHTDFWVIEARRASDGSGEGVRKRDERETRQRGRLCESYSNGLVRLCESWLFELSERQRKN
jgi:hypothetical protein